MIGLKVDVIYFFRPLFFTLYVQNGDTVDVMQFILLCKHNFIKCS